MGTKPSSIDRVVVVGASILRWLKREVRGWWWVQSPSSVEKRGEGVGGGRKDPH